MGCVGLNLSELAMTREHLGSPATQMLTRKCDFIVPFHNKCCFPKSSVEARGADIPNSYTIQSSEKSPRKW